MDSSTTPKPKSKPRIALTKSQLEDPAALDLLAMLQSVTSDGKVLEEEVNSLKEWLESQRTSPLPAIQHLIGVVKEILADGRITDLEREYLQKAIETVLPRGQREVAVLRRRERVADEKQEKAEFKRKNAPLADFDFMVAGVSFEGRQKIISDNKVAEGDTVFLLREPQNLYSRNAIQIRIKNGPQIGFVPEKVAVIFAPLLDEGARHSATIKKILQGRQGPIPVVWGELYPKDCTLADGVSQNDIPEHCKQIRAASKATLPTTAVTEPQCPQPVAPDAPKSRISISRLVGWGLALLLLVLVLYSALKK
jgi:hypothetical protein